MLKIRSNLYFYVVSIAHPTVIENGAGSNTGILARFTFYRFSSEQHGEPKQQLIYKQALSITTGIFQNSSQRISDPPLPEATYSPKLRVRVERQSGEIL